MMEQHKMNICTSISESRLDEYTVSFKGDFLGQLIDAVALLEVLEVALNHHEDAGLSKTGFMGMTILVEQIKQLLDINSNLLPDAKVVYLDNPKETTQGDEGSWEPDCLQQQCN